MDGHPQYKPMEKSLTFEIFIKSAVCSEKSQNWCGYWVTSIVQKNIFIVTVTCPEGVDLLTLAVETVYRMYNLLG